MIAYAMFSHRNDIRADEINSDRVNGRIRRSFEERVAFALNCSEPVRAVARALYERFGELGISSPFAQDDTAWFDLADIAIRTAYKHTVEFQREAQKELELLAEVRKRG